MIEISQEHTNPVKKIRDKRAELRLVTNKSKVTSKLKLENKHSKFEKLENDGERSWGR